MSPAITSPDQETLKGSPLNRLTTTSDEAVHMERVTMKTPGSRTSVHAPVQASPGDEVRACICSNVDNQTVTVGSDV